MSRNRYFNDSYTSSTESGTSSYKSDSEISQKEIIAEKYKTLLKSGCPKRIIRNKDVKFWSLIAEGWSYLDITLAWDKLLRVMQHLDKWFIKNSIVGTTINLVVFLRFFLHLLKIVKEVENKVSYKKTMKSIETKAFLNLQKTLKFMLGRHNKEIEEYNENAWPFMNTSPSIRLRIEEYILTDPRYSLNLSELSLSSLPTELLNFDKALAYYRSIVHIVELPKNSPLFLDNLRSIDLSFNHLSVVLDPLQKMSKLQGLCFLNLMGNSISKIQSSLVSSLSFKDLICPNFPSTRYSSSLTQNAENLSSAKITGPKSLVLLALESCSSAFYGRKKLEKVSKRLQLLLKAFQKCEVCTKSFIDSRGLPGVYPVLNWRGILFHPTYTEEYWIERDTTLSSDLGESLPSRISMLRNFCPSCFLIHAKSVTTPLSTEGECICATCANRNISIFSYSPHFSLTITRSCKTFLSQLK